MAEDVSNYPLSTELNDSIPLEVAKPARVYILPRNTTGVALTLSEDDNNIFSISSDFLCFVSTNAAIDNYSDVNLSGVNNGLYVITPGYTHVLALPKNCWIFSNQTDAAAYIYAQEIVRWAALGGQAVAFEVS